MKKQSNATRHHQQQPEQSWRRSVVRKWLNIPTNNSDFSADSDSSCDSDSNSDQESFDSPKESRFKNDKRDEVQVEAHPKIGRRRRKSETFRAQYINAKEIRVCAATWNVGGRTPPDDLDVDGWLDIDDPADIYVIGLQEIIPLNAGNIFGAEDNRPVSKWENIIRQTLNQVLPTTKFKSYSDPSSPSRFKPSEDAADIEAEIVLESDSDTEEQICPLNEELDVINETFVEPVEQKLEKQFPSSKRFDRLNCLRTDSEEKSIKKLVKTLSGTERIGLSWPETPLHLLDNNNPIKSLKTSKSFRTYSSFKSTTTPESRMRFEIASLAELDLESLINRKRRPQYVRMMSKQMVGVFITIWVRRSLRRHIQNLHVSSVGVGVMGYIGNKGSISVSMSVHQTLFCFVCTHLTSGEKDENAMKRNADVQEIHRRTRFSMLSAMGLPRTIYDHERIIWLGDLNYRINLSYERTRELILKKEWWKLVEHDQLTREFKKGRVFDGWSEGTLNFAPTYKYDLNSESYIKEDHKTGRRTPAWCDRILSYGTGMKLVKYRRSELMFSDHRPVTASYVVEVEVFSPKKLQRALTFTDAEVEEQDIVADMALSSGLGLGLLRLEEDATYWDR